MRRAFGAVLLAVLPFTPLMAQTAAPTMDGRVSKLEKEMRAVQRKVFPTGAGQYFEPEMTPTPSGVTPGSPSASPVADLTARVDAIENQLRSLTGQVEQLTYRNRRLEEDFTRFRAETDAKLGGVASAEAGDTAPPQITPAKPTPGAPPVQPPKLASAGTSTSAPTPARPAPASGDRKAAVAAVERPSTGDAPNDAYTYGYRLWSAKFYPEAQVQLKATVDKYPNSSIVSRTQNLLGRAYLDDGKPNLAALAFRDSYEKWPNGDRAADSLAWLGESLIRLKKPADACKVYGVLESNYGSNLTGSQRDMMTKGRVTAKCG